MPTPPNIGIPGGPPLAFDEFTLTWAVVLLVLLAATTLVIWLLRARKRARNGCANGAAGSSSTITLAPKRGPRRVA